MQRQPSCARRGGHRARPMTSVPRVRPTPPRSSRRSFTSISGSGSLGSSAPTRILVRNDMKPIVRFRISVRLGSCRFFGMNPPVVTCVIASWRRRGYGGLPSERTTYQEHNHGTANPIRTYATPKRKLPRAHFGLRSAGKRSIPSRRRSRSSG